MNNTCFDFVTRELDNVRDAIKEIHRARARLNSRLQERIHLGNQSEDSGERRINHMMADAYDEAVKEIDEALREYSNGKL